MKRLIQRVWLCATGSGAGDRDCACRNGCARRKAQNLRAAQPPYHHTQEEPKSEKAEGREQVKEGEEADAIRNAPAVKWIARHTGLTNDGAYWLCIGLNFAVIFFAIAGLMRKILPGYFKGRTTTIQKGIEDARKMSEDARRRLAEVEGRLSRLDADIAAMRREADENAKAEEQRLLAAGEEERKRIVTSAEQEIEIGCQCSAPRTEGIRGGTCCGTGGKEDPREQ